MKLKFIIYSILCLLLIVVSCRKKEDISTADEALNQSSTSINFIVKDQSTDFGISNATITVNGPDGKASTLKVADNGKVSFAATGGKYTFIINANGYKSMETFFVGGVETDIEANINLDPINTASGTTTLEVVKDKVVLTGYVKDADENTALSGVQITAGGATGTTNSKGYFTIQVAAQPLGEREVPQTISIKVGKEGYSDYSITNFYLIPDTYTLKIPLTSLTTKVKQMRSQGEVKNLQPQQVTEKHGMFDRTAAEEIERYRDMPSASIAPKSQLGRTAAVTVPGTIRVGTSCNCHSCSSVQVMSLEAYTQSGLDEEWISSWGAASLQAGAVAYRSYGAWWVNNPIASNFDISSTTCAQVWGSDIVTSTKNAAIATTGQVLVRSGAIFKSEYSSENNNAGCGNGYSGTGGTYPSGWPCISDSRCAGRTKFGHGRGMCQYGSSFWASDKTAAWILDHYYTPGGVTVQGGGTPPPAGVFDAFTSNVGRFNTAPTYSGSTLGIATTSTATWDSGSASLKLTLNDNTSITTPWFVRLLSGTGTPANNVLSPKTGTLYFSLKTSTAQAGATVRIWVDDSDGTEQSPPITIINDGVMHTYSWNLSSYGGTGIGGGNGVIDATNVTLDAIILEQANTATQWVSYIDNLGN